MNLSYLFFLACPIGMGVMMWMMMRGQGQQATGGQATSPLTTSNHELARLRGQLQELQEQHAALIAEVDKLSAQQPAGERRQ